MQQRRHFGKIWLAWTLLGGATLGACGDDEPAQHEPTVRQCGDERVLPVRLTQPIVGGSDSFDPELIDLSAGQVLAVGALMEDTGFAGFENICTGTLIAPDAVLSAAHCVVYGRGRVTAAADLRFAVGADVADPVASFEVRQVIPHPQYNPRGTTAAHDVSLLLLKEPATGQLPGIQPLPFRCEDLGSEQLVGRRVQNVGYGAIDRQGMQTTTHQLWAEEEVVSVSQIDFTVDGKGEEGVCYGDSGGPALHTAATGVQVIGTLSWGDELCGDRDHFVRVDQECDFIREHLDPCAGLTAEGRCEDQQAVYCAESTLQRDDCAATGEICAATEAGTFRCQPDPCAGETEAGRCEGEVAIYCGDRTVVREDCAGQGNLCAGDAQGRQRCVPDPCGEETEAGRCEGATAIYCTEGTLVRQPCTEQTELCGADDLGRMRCLPDPCQGESAEGRCEGNTAVHCGPGQMVREECREKVELCGADDQGRMRCLPDPCQGETAEGRCAGDQAIWCEGGQIKVRRCADCGQTCGWSETHSTFYCLAP